MITSLIARVDAENNAEEFWAAFREAAAALNHDSELARNCRQILGSDEVELLDAEAIQEFDNFVTRLPGWSTGPDYAKTAIVFTPADGDSACTA